MTKVVWTFVMQLALFNSPEAEVSYSLCQLTFQLSAKVNFNLIIPKLVTNLNVYSTIPVHN